jgi:outer membrane protein OmpA-like peptidoglycan-associated protein
MIKQVLALSLGCFLLAAATNEARDETRGRILRFKHVHGEKYRIITEVDEDILINGAPSHRSLILNKVAVETVEVRDGAGRLDCDFQMSESIEGKFNSFHLKENYRSDFWRDRQGVYTIDRSYFMPVVRNVPFFPEGAVKPGDTWTGDAFEAHDFRRNYGIARPFHFPVKAHYTYLRVEVIDGVQAAVLKVEFTVFHRVSYDTAPSRPAPLRITGMSSQLYWWDIDAGLFHSYQEDFNFIFFLSGGATVEFGGKARGRLLRSPVLDRDRVADDLTKKIMKENIADTSVRKDKEGVTIVLENVQFPPNSAELAGAERDKLDRVAEMLKQFSQRDFLVTGHTARVGDERTSQILSEQRAMAVADYLMGRGACDRTRIVTRGRGSREPAGDNATEEGRRKNRRVEITILEN